MEETVKKAQTNGTQANSAQAGFLDSVNAAFCCSVPDLRTYSPLTLAYIGDAVYELVIRSVVVERANCSVNKLNNKTTAYVKAEAQAKMVSVLLKELTEEEEAVYKRGRNAKPHSMAKNASSEDYHKATGYEALIGHLYLSGQTERMLELIRRGMELAGMEL